MKLKEYKCISLPNVFSTFRNVVFVESHRDNIIESFIIENYDEICRLFSLHNLYFHYLPINIKDRENYKENDGTSLNSFDTCACICDEITKKFHLQEPAIEKIPLNVIIELANLQFSKYIDRGEFGDNRIEVPASLCFCNFNWHGKRPNEIIIKTVPFDGSCDLMEQFRERVKYIGTFFPDLDEVISDKPVIVASMTPSMIEKTKLFYEDITDEGATGDEILDLILSIDRDNKKGKILISKDFNIYFEKYNHKKLDITNLPKAVYLFFLRLDHAIPLYDLYKYMPELTYIYIKTRNSKRYNPIKVINNLVNVQIGNNLTGIRKAINRSFKIKPYSIYSVEGVNNQDNTFSIGIPPEDRVWEDRSFKDLKIPQLRSPEASEMRTWEILHQMDDSEINQAIGVRPPKWI